METALNIKSKTQSQKDITKSVQNINPNATEAVLYQFAIDYNDLSNQTFVNVVRIDKTTLSGGNS